MRTLVTHSSPDSIPSEKEKGHSHGDTESGGSHPASCRHVVLLGLHPDSGPIASAAPILLPPICLCVLLHAASSQPRRILHITGISRPCPLALLMLSNELRLQPAIHPSIPLSARLSVHQSVHPPYLYVLRASHSSFGSHLEALHNEHLSIWTHYSRLSTQVKRCPFLLSPCPPPSSIQHLLPQTTYHYTLWPLTFLYPLKTKNPKSGSHISFPFGSSEVSRLLGI